MKYHLKKLWVLITAGIIYVVGQYFRGLWFENLPLNACQYGYDSHGRFCNSPYVDNGWALIMAGEVFAAVGIVVLFANERGWRKWLKFSYWYVPITAVITIWAFPMPFFMNQIGRDIAVRDFGVIYIVLTLIIVIWAAVAERRNRVRKTA